MSQGPACASDSDVVNAGGCRADIELGCASTRGVTITVEGESGWKERKRPCETRGRRREQRYCSSKATDTVYANRGEYSPKTWLGCDARSGDIYGNVRCEAENSGRTEEGER